MPTLDGSDSLSVCDGELEQHSRQSAPSLQQEVIAAELSCRQVEELSAVGSNLGHNSATESRLAPEIQVKWEGNMSAHSDPYPAQKQPTKAQPEEAVTQLQAVEGPTKLQPEMLHVNEQPEQEDGNAEPKGTESAAEFSDLGPGDTGDGQHAVKTSEEHQTQPRDKLESQVPGLKPLTTNGTESVDHPAHAVEMVVPPENAQLACSENGQQGDSPGVHAEDLKHSLNQTEMAIETEAVQQFGDKNVRPDEAGPDLHTLQAAETGTSSVQGDDSDDFSLGNVAGSRKSDTLGIKVADDHGSEQRPAKEDLSFCFPRPKDADQAGVFTNSADSSKGSFTLKSRLPALLAAAAAAKEGLPGATTHQQEPLPGQRPVFKGAPDISDEWNEDDDPDQLWNRVEAESGPKVFSKSPDFQLPALHAEASTAGSAGQTADADLGKGSYDGTPSQKLELPSDLIEFDDLPIMRKRPRRKTKDAAAPGAANDGQPGSSTGAAALVSKSNSKPASSSGSVAGDQAFCCNQCSFSAGSALLLDRHQRVEHPFGQRHSETFECELCGVQANSRETYQSHLLGRPHAVKERAVMSLQALRRMEETVRPNSERADLARMLQEPGGMPHTRSSLPPATGTCLKEETAVPMRLPPSIRKALVGPRPGSNPHHGRGQASQRQRCLIFKDLPPRPLRAYSPPSAASSAASSVAATRPRPKSLIAASTTKSVSTASHSPAAAASSARPTWSSHDSGRSAVSGTGTTLTRLSAASVRSLFQCPLTKELMKDPVVCADGHTYEREAIEKYLSQHGKSPLTGQPVPKGAALAPNRLVRQAAAEAGISVVDLRPSIKGASTSSASSSSAAL